MSTTTSTSPYLPVRDDWLARRTETILEPGLPIVDPHHHLWERPGWRYMFDELLADTNSGHNIVATVFVQCRSMHRADRPGGNEAGRRDRVRQWRRGDERRGPATARPRRVPASSAMPICGWATRARGVLEAHIRAGGNRFRGIRHITAWDTDPTLMNPAYAPPPGLIADRTFREGFSTLAPLNLSFDAWLYHPQIDELTALAQAFPGTRICLNHVGGPLAIGVYAGKRDAVFAEWSKSIRALAQCPNVVVKVGGMAMRINGFDFHEKADPPSSEALAAAWKPYVETCIEAFGAARCMFESNFPVDKGSYAYAPFWNACKMLTRGASATEKTDLFSGTAARFYRLNI